MKKLIVHGDPGLRKDGVINYDGQELRVFSVQRQGEYHGPEEPQLWCTIGTDDERDAFEKKEYVPHWLDVDTIDAEALDIVKKGGDLTV
ncbi:HAH_0734 family protein [Halobaculum marinum]|uniref:HAH_0734 family protein n=1 Tax=Halobaculum marinum TaxID=3031996 RepID=A0ABD5WW45_9EURY|nr:HAH_0734 family protein [Halobaculum sp. DT55]